MSKKQTNGTLSGLLMLGLLGLVSGSSYGLDRFPVSSDPEQKAHADYANRILAPRGLKHLFACGGYLSPTFLSLSREIREHDVELAIRYDHSQNTYARLRLSPTVSGLHMASVIYVPLRSKSRQLGSIGHELYHMLTVLQAGREGLLSVTEESRAKEIGMRVANEAVSRAGGRQRPVQDATDVSSLSC